MFGRFRRKKEDTDTKESTEVTADDPNPKFRSDDDRDSSKYTFRRPREEEVSLTQVLSRLLERLNSLDKQRTDLEQDIYQLGGEAEKEAEDLEKELSTLKEQTRQLEEVLSIIHSHRKVAYHRELGH